MAADIPNEAVIDTAMISKPAVLDFNKKSNYKIVHNARGSINIQRRESQQAYRQVVDEKWGTGQRPAMRVFRQKGYCESCVYPR